MLTHDAHPHGQSGFQDCGLIIDLLHGLSREGKTVVVATHSAEVAGKADMVLEIVDGRLAGCVAAN